MGLFSFCFGNQDSLAPLRQIILSLQGKKEDQVLDYLNYKTTSSDQDISNADPDDLNQVNPYKIKSTKIREVTLKETDLYQIKSINEMEAMKEPLKNLYKYLYTTEGTISDRNIYHIGEKAHTLIEKLDALLQDPRRSDDSLNEVLKAKEDFRRACTIMKTSTMILCFVAAILAAVAAIIVAPPTMIVGVKVIISTGAAMAAALGVKKLAQPAPIEHYAEVEDALKTLLPVQAPSNSPRKRIVSSNINFAAQCQQTHKSVTEDLYKPQREDELHHYKPRGINPFSRCM